MGFFGVLHFEFQFGCDAAASDGRLLPYWYGPGAPTLTDSLTGPDWIPQDGPFYLNPPYGRAIGTWLQRAADQAVATRQTVVVLHPARTDTAWWHDIVLRYAFEVRLLRGRLSFLDDDGQTVHPALFPSAVSVFTPFHVLNQTCVYGWDWKQPYRRP
jgi:DNA N-6-adenine-methyltransferase (Dam)